MNDKLIIFGPGFADPSLVIDQLAKKFDKGFDRLVLSYVDRGTRHPIEETAANLYPMIAILRKSYKYVFFVGHSMGGLVGRELMAMHDDELLFDAYVSIGTPHTGTVLASLAPERLFKDISPSMLAMRPNSSFMDKIEASRVKYFVPGRKCYTPAFTIGAQFEEMVLPHSSAHIEGVANRTTIPWTSHVTVALSQRTYLEIWAFFTYEILMEVNPGEIQGIFTRL